MALKLKITKEAYALLSEEVKKEYAASGDDYTLALEGYEDPGELRRARDREKQDAAEAKRKLQLAEDENTELKRKVPRESGDIAALESSWKLQRETEVGAEKEVSKKLKNQVQTLLVSNVAQTLAQKISTAPTLILPHITKRLKVEYPADGGDPVTRVLDKDGKLSALTVSELEAELVATAEFSAIIVASKASGGGAAGNQGGGAPKAFSEMGDAERSELYRANPAEFKRQSAAAKPK